MVIDTQPTPSQTRTLDRIHAAIVHHCSPNAPSEFEFKRWNPTLLDYGVASLVFEYGYIGDENDLRAIYCRYYGHYFIGKRGGVRVATLRSGTTPVEKRFYHLYGGRKGVG